MNLTIEEWEQKIKKWDMYPDAVKEIVYTSSKEELIKLITLLVHYVGLVNEIGELGGKIKKEIRDKKQIPTLRDLDKGSEAGDVDWYLTTIDRDLGFTKKEIINLNNKKLTKREQKGMMHGSGDHREENTGDR